jgi:protein phosphatase 2C family protein 2/3
MIVLSYPSLSCSQISRSQTRNQYFILHTLLHYPNACVHAAEFRGPGIHHRYDDSPEDFDMDLQHDSRARSFGGLGGRIILLGDGTEIDPDGPEADMFDHEDEDGDLQHQVGQGRVEEVDDDADADTNEGERRQREGTPGPEKAKIETTESPSSVNTEKSEAETQKEAASKPVAAAQEKLAATEEKLPTPAKA